MIILKCPRTMAPRLKVQKSIRVIKKNARKELGEHPTKGTCKWEDFCANADYYSAGSDVTPMYYIKGKDAGYDYVACSGINSKLYDLFVKSTSEGKSLSVLIYNPFPSVDYYKNMSAYMDAFSSNEELCMEPLFNYEEWNPEELAFDEANPNDIFDTIMKTLEEEQCCIVQGPSGTGKSYIDTIIAAYLTANKTVGVTTMANKGLVELIKQDSPDVISRIDKKYPIILSERITDELNKMKIKLEEQRKRNAEKVLYMFNNEFSHEIIYEFADLSLLPSDFDRRSPDNMILSVALKYKDENPIMLTSNNGLQLKSKILGISTVSLKNFLKR